MTTITSANSVFTITIAGLYNSPVQLQGYATDDAFAADAAKPAEAVMGVDGRMSAGFTPFMTEQPVSLQADSASNQVFDDWIAAMKVAREILFANATIILPSVAQKYALTQGVLTSLQSFAGVRKMLEARKFIITWADISAAPF